MIDAKYNSYPWFQRLVLQPTALTFGYRTQERVLLGTLFYDHCNPSTPEKKQKPTEWCLPGDWCVLAEKSPRVSLKHCKFQHYVRPRTPHLKTVLITVIMWTHLLEILAARLRARHILFQKSHCASSNRGSAGSYGPGQ